MQRRQDEKQKQTEDKDYLQIIVINSSITIDDRVFEK